MRKAFRVFDLTVDIAMIACSVGFVGLAFMQVIFRFVLNSSLAWSEELCRYLFAEMVFLGAGVCLLEKKHASVDVVPNALPKKIRKQYQAVLDVLVIITGVLLTIYGYQFAVKAIGQTSPALRIPYQYIYMGIVVSGAVITLNAGRALYTTLTGKSTYHSFIDPQLNRGAEEQIC